MGVLQCGADNFECCRTCPLFVGALELQTAVVSPHGVGRDSADWGPQACSLLHRPQCA